MSIHSQLYQNNKKLIKEGDKNKVWISKKKWKQLEKRIADLENRIQDQSKEILAKFSQQMEWQREQQTKRSMPPRRKW